VSAVRPPLQRTWLPWLPLLAVLALALGVGSFGSRGPVTDEDRALALARVVQCPTCQGETAAESNAPAARDVRVEIDEQVRAGRTDEQVLAAIEQAYPGTAMNPPSSGLVALVAAIAGLAVAFRRWGEPAPARATAADKALVEQALGDGEGT
jgi:cytochrome c-type biogenesis protein CcmH